MSGTAIYKLEKFISSGEPSVKHIEVNYTTCHSSAVRAIMDTQKLDCGFHN